MNEYELKSKWKYYNTFYLALEETELQTEELSYFVMLLSF